jgi:phage shock protein A
MALIQRITRLFKADFHAVLDQLEEPEQVLRQAVREMEDELGTMERRIAALAHEQESLAARSDEIAAELADVDAQLDLCFRSGRDELARKMIRRKLETERLLKRLVANRQANEKELAEQRRLYDEDSSVLQSLRQKSELFMQRSAVAADRRGDAGELAWMTRQMSVSDEEVEIAYLREKDLRTVS